MRTTTIRFIPVLALLTALILVAAPVSANHLSDPLSVSCDGTGSVTVSIIVFNGGAGNDTTQGIFIGGVMVKTIDFGYGIPDGIYTRTVFIDEATPGTQVTVTDFESAISTVCSFYDAPGIPAGFELHSITCNTFVYSGPGASPVGSNVVTMGQTWYVNPTPVTAADGSSWTEIFTSSSPNGFIPTTCVGGPV